MLEVFWVVILHSLLIQYCCAFSNAHLQYFRGKRLCIAVRLGLKAMNSNKHLAVSIMFIEYFHCVLNAPPVFCQLYFVEIQS